MIPKGGNRGFTIVELLIVIVIIGVLAAIIASVYSGIQDRANNQKTEAVVAEYKKALIQYAVTNGVYPAGTYVCLGEPAYPNCAGTATGSSVFNNAIRPFMGNVGQLPQPAIQILQYGAQQRAGAAYHYNAASTLDGSPHPWGINYITKGTGQCKLPGVAGNPAGFYWPNFSTTPNTSGHTESQSGNSFCRLILPNPANL